LWVASTGQVGSIPTLSANYRAELKYTTNTPQFVGQTW